MEIVYVYSHDKKVRVFKINPGDTHVKYQTYIDDFKYCRKAIILQNEGAPKFIAIFGLAKSKTTESQRYFIQPFIDAANAGKTVVLKSAENTSKLKIDPDKINVNDIKRIARRHARTYF